jgi:hypothetical protein
LAAPAAPSVLRTDTTLPPASRCTTTLRSPPAVVAALAGKANQSSATSRAGPAIGVAAACTALAIGLPSASITCTSRRSRQYAAR